MTSFPLSRTACGAVIVFTIAAANAIAQDEAAQLFEKAYAASQQGDSKQAVELLNQAIDLKPDRAVYWRWRGREQFRLGKIDQSLTNFDQFVKLASDAEKTLWERGISHYYATKYEQGAAQFELYQTYHDSDVENATWRYLCVARGEGVEAARKTLLPIKGDRRVPMMEIYALYQGKQSVDDVLAAANAGEPTKEQLNRRLFYAHLYIGLHYEAAGDQAAAKRHITKAANEHMIGHYMGDVARVHAAMLRKQD